MTRSCLPCPKNNYIDVNTTQCLQCPHDTVIRSGKPWGREACMRCGEGLRPVQHPDGDVCVSSCRYTSLAGKNYDFRGLTG